MMEIISHEEYAHKYYSCLTSRDEAWKITKDGDILATQRINPRDQIGFTFIVEGWKYTRINLNWDEEGSSHAHFKEKVWK